MNEECDAILRNQPWGLVELFENKIPIGRKLLYKPKFKVDGSFDKYKEILFVSWSSIGRVGWVTPFPLGFESHDACSWSH